VLPVRKLLPRIVLASAALGLSLAASAQTDSPAKFPALVRLVVPFSAGGSNDVIARAIAPELARRLATSVIVENKPGAAGTIGSDAVAKGPKDGSTLLLTSSSLLTAAATMTRSPYDVLTAFAPVAMIGQGPMLVAVSSGTSIMTPADLVAAARVKPGALTYGTSGPGSIAHLSTELLGDAAKAQMTHIPYKGAANALLDLSSGQIQMMISNYSSLVPQIKAGRVRPIAVTSRQPSASFPDLPPMAVAAPGFGVDIWVSVLAPAGTPAPLVHRLNREINEIARQAEVRALLESDGAVPTPLTPAEVAQRMKDDLATWKKIASEKNIVTV
jgi:tripartite-type tricarboxylate transporter receptor subunit TctC